YDLYYHKQIRNSDYQIKVSTSFRPDKAISIEAENYISYLKKLSNATDIEISSYGNLKDALLNRIRYFHNHGCRLSDHGLAHMPFEKYSDSEINEIFTKRF